MIFGGIFDLEEKEDRLNEILLELENPNIWDKKDSLQTLNKEKNTLSTMINEIKFIENTINESLEFLCLSEIDQIIINNITEQIPQIKKNLEKLEFVRMFSGKNDQNNAFLDIQAGSGGTEAQDWAEMLMRMYIRWGENHNIQTKIISLSNGEIAGIKSCTLHFTGEYYPFGWLRTETGIHRLVRKSPFNSGNRRHTSFASVFVSPEINNDIKIDIDLSTLKIDTYRASGAGGQHINKTDSAVRITHKPTGIVVQCQNDRSQHRNKEQAMKQLRSKLYEFEYRKKQQEKNILEQNKATIGWGNQIRSYVLDQSRIKDLRTNIEISDVQDVLNGNLDKFIKASLQMNL